jgi:hypothetical protein
VLAEEEEGALSFLVLFAVTDSVLPDQVQMVVSGDGYIEGECPQHAKKMIDIPPKKKHSTTQVAPMASFRPIWAE